MYRELDFTKASSVFCGDAIAHIASQVQEMRSGERLRVLLPSGEETDELVRVLGQSPVVKLVRVARTDGVVELILEKA